MDPLTMYGITKLHVEHLARFYHRKFGVNARSLRYPGVLSVRSPPGGGVTDWAIEMVRAAVAGRDTYQCFLQPSAAQPMVHVEDLIDGTMRYIAAPLLPSMQSVYNIQGLSFSPRELEMDLRLIMPRFRVRYRPDERQTIADSWPASLDDSLARAEWGWAPKMDSLPVLVTALVKGFTEQLELEERIAADER